ncbi:MAG: EamA family transporter [Methylocystis sp.]
MEIFYLAILAALLAALCQSLTDITTKLAVDYAHDEEILAAQWVSGAIILIIFSLFSYPRFLIHPIDTSNALLGVDFFKLLLFSAIINIIAYSFYIIALRASQASLIIPLVLITPIFMLFTSPIMLGENTPPIGIIGVILIFIGLGIFDTNFFQMDKNFYIVLKNHCALDMLASAVLLIVTSNI